VAELEASSRLESDVDGYRVRVVRVNGKLYAFEDRCTHDDSPFDDGPIEDT
jgi:nitrite reductase/ring-hydroxylating ferredoxin subunit